jgi:small nuclear ribonucleoprotein (snRNP)-like protein
MSRKEALSQFIQQIHGRPVVVKLNSGVDYRGKVVKILASSLLSWVSEVLCSL